MNEGMFTHAVLLFIISFGVAVGVVIISMAIFFIKRYISKFREKSNSQPNKRNKFWKHKAGIYWRGKANMLYLASC